MRHIAQVTGVNAALVIRYYGSKEALFLDTVSIENRFSGLTDPPMVDIGRAIVEPLVRPKETSRLFCTVLLRAADRPEIRTYVANAIAQQVVEPLSQRLAGEDACLRARLIAAQITDLLNEMWVLEDPELRQMPDRNIDRYGASNAALVDV